MLLSLTVFRLEEFQEGVSAMRCVDQLRVAGEIHFPNQNPPVQVVHLLPRVFLEIRECQKEVRAILL